LASFDGFAGKPIFLGKLARTVQSQRRLEPGSGQKAFLPAAFFPLFRLAVERVNPLGQRESHMKQLIQTKILTALVSLALTLICFAFMQERKLPS
jgi:hypothetical protein